MTTIDETRCRVSPPKRRKWRFGWIDVALLALVSAGFAYFAHQTDAVLHYRWDWSVIAAYLVKTDPKTGGIAPNVLLDGLLTTIRLAVWGLALATIIGVVMGFARTSRRLLPRLIAGAYVILIRNIPPLVFIFIFVFFIASQVLPSLGIAETVDHASETTRWWLSLFFGPPRLIENFAAGLLCLSIFAGAYLTEIVRAGIESVPKSQIEAGDSLGLSRFDILAFVVLPQAVRNVVPPLANQSIQMIKDSSLMSLVSVQELSFVAQDVQVATHRVFEVLLFTGGMYFVICYGLSLAFGRLERHAAIARG
jgi:polar amino acid transport system permease protein